LKQVGGRTVWTVAELTKAIWRRFEDVPSVWIEAEISNLARRGQQVYFTLLEHGDDPHLVDASMNAAVYDRLPGHPGNGTLVHAYGRVEYWRQRSQVRFRAQRLELTGDGLLLARIDELRRRLGAEGLTADERKRPIPLLPRRIGLVTSGEGAARADFLTNVAKRFPAASVLVVRSLVQGEGAPAEIVRAIGYLDGQPDVDVIVLARGGGPLEDLMAFNSELVCRAVAGAATPIVSAVGHETDITVCDLVADLRVSTPTKAAEAVVPDATELGGLLDRGELAMSRAVRQAIAVCDRRLAASTFRLGQSLRSRGDVAGARAQSLATRLGPALLANARQAPIAIVSAHDRLLRGARTVLAHAGDEVERMSALHGLLSPSRTVARGYAIVRDRESGRVIAERASTAAGQRLAVELRDGLVDVQVEDTGIETR
jgi:exodeoxyribonuclease VII large subunit